MEWRRGHALAGLGRSEIDGPGGAVVWAEWLPVLACRGRWLRPGRFGPRRRTRALAALAAAGDLDVALTRPSRRPPALARRRVARRGYSRRVSSRRAGPREFAALS